MTATVAMVCCWWDHRRRTMSKLGPRQKQYFDMHIRTLFVIIVAVVSPRTSTSLCCACVTIVTWCVSGSRAVSTGLRCVVRTSLIADSVYCLAAPGIVTRSRHFGAITLTIAITTITPITAITPITTITTTTTITTGICIVIATACTAVAGSCSGAGWLQRGRS